MNEYISEFKALTDSMINALHEEDFDNFIELLEKRQQVIDSMRKEGMKLSDYVQAEEKNNMMQNERQLEELLSSKKEEIKGKIVLLNKGSKVKNSYNTSFYASTKIFSKKV